MNKIAVVNVSRCPRDNGLKPMGLTVLTELLPVFKRLSCGCSGVMISRQADESLSPPASRE
jgi:hypothetical protein